MSNIVMRLVDPATGRMECKVCGSVHSASIKPGGRYVRGSWQCRNGCKLTLVNTVNSRMTDLRNEHATGTTPA